MYCSAVFCIHPLSFYLQVYISWAFWFKTFLRNFKTHYSSPSTHIINLQREYFIIWNGSIRELQKLTKASNCRPVWKSLLQVTYTFLSQPCQNITHHRQASIFFLCQLPKAQRMKTTYCRVSSDAPSRHTLRLLSAQSTKTKGSINTERQPICTHRNLGQNWALFSFGLEHARFPADSESQVLTAFQHRPTFPPQFLIPLACSTHSLFMHRSSTINQICCSERNTLIPHSSHCLHTTLLTPNTTIKHCSHMWFLGVKKLLLSTLGRPSLP